MRQETRYVHRGDLERRQAKVRRWRKLIVSGAVGAVALLLGAQALQERAATASMPKSPDWLPWKTKRKGSSGTTTSDPE